MCKYTLIGVFLLVSSRLAIKLAPQQDFTFCSNTLWWISINVCSAVQVDCFKELWRFSWMKSLLPCYELRCFSYANDCGQKKNNSVNSFWSPWKCNFTSMKGDEGENVIQNLENQTSLHLISNLKWKSSKSFPKNHFNERRGCWWWFARFVSRERSTDSEKNIWAKSWISLSNLLSM